jgi:triosephosphate isomerase
MLQDFGCTMVIVGHSERRGFHAETDERCAAKALHAIRSGLQVVFCVGEKLEQRELGTTAEVVRGQLDVLLRQLEAPEMERLVVAYEPIWAIGTGKTATPEQAQAVHKDLRTALMQRHPAQADQVPLLYGGSVKPGNAKALFEMADIDGGLIGGASLVAPEFLSIVAASAAVK